MNGSRSLWPAGLCLGGLLPWLAAQQAPPPSPPARFERVLWVGDAASRAGAAREAGFTAVQLGRGVDPAPVVAAGLGYYLDQPVGKGVLELRDEQWLPLRQTYERTRDPAVLVRPGCFATPGLVDDVAAAAAAAVQAALGPGLRFVALADEASATRRDAPLDTCRCEVCMRDFRRFVQGRFATIDELNAAFGSQHASFADVVPPTTDQVRRRELGDVVLPRDLRAYGLLRQFADEQWARGIGALAAAARRAAPGVPVGLTGSSAPAAFGGSDAARLLPLLTLAEPYAIGGAPELAASLLPPGAHRYATLFPPGPDSEAATVPPGQLVRARFAAMAAHGLAGAVVWNDANVFAPGGGLSPFGRAVREAALCFSTELDACAGASIEPGDCWVVESQASVRAWWMLDSARDGPTWPRRLPSYEAEHSTSQAARLGWTRLLQDLGLQPHFVGEDALAERLLLRQPRCLVLPATIALADRAAQAIMAFVRAGGTVLADHSTALYDEVLRQRPAGALDELFGIRQRSLRWEDLLVREGRSAGSAQGGLPLAERRLGGRLGERRRDGDPYRENRVGRGRAVYLNAPVCDYPRVRLDEVGVDVARELRRRVRAVLQQASVEPPCDVRGAGLPTCVERVPLRLRDGRSVLAIRLHALDAPALLANLAAQGPRPVVVELPRERHLRHLGGEDLGTAARFELRLDPFGALFLEDAAR
ncbi:MAG: hypothetical protein FJ265_04925 [Planctomycetes bacterium]|nr:hypothetical protein [Planctomycetota bacterium]